MAVLVFNFELNKHQSEEILRSLEFALLSLWPFLASRSTNLALCWHLVLEGGARVWFLLATNVNTSFSKHLHSARTRVRTRSRPCTLVLGYLEYPVSEHSTILFRVQAPVLGHQVWIQPYFFNMWTSVRKLEKGKNVILNLPCFYVGLSSDQSKRKQKSTQFIVQTFSV